MPGTLRFMEREGYGFSPNILFATFLGGDLGLFGSHITTPINGATCERLRTMRRSQNGALYRHSFIYLSFVFSSQFVYLRRSPFVQVLRHLRTGRMNDVISYYLGNRSPKNENKFEK